jgi:predicted NBD/HSP70 family sugar kinase
VLDEWTELVGEFLCTIQVLHDPDCVVLGGGVSRAPSIAVRLGEALMRVKLGEMRLPQIRIARHGRQFGRTWRGLDGSRYRPSIRAPSASTVAPDARQLGGPLSSQSD